MIDFVHFEYEPGDKDAVLKWFHENDDQRQMILEYFSQKSSSTVNFKIEDIVDQFDFVESEEVGFFPADLIYDLDQFDQIWFEKSSLSDNYRALYRILWFLVAEWMIEEERTFEVFPLAKELDVIQNLKDSAQQGDELQLKDMDDLYYGWRTKTFSNKKIFTPIEKFEGVNLKLADEIESLDTWFFPSEVFESSASVLKTEDGSLFLVVDFMDSYVMHVESISEAKTVLQEIWN